MNPPAQPVAAPRGPRIFLSAGEISGDFQAAHLARSLRRAEPAATLYGCGGERMKDAGVDVRLQTAQLGYVGLEESLPFRRPIRGAHRWLAEMLRDDPPDLAVLVDGERFNGPLMDVLNERRIPFIYYFVPQVWFWGRWRTRRLARLARLVIPAFPVERDIFREKGARAEWLGHPLIDIVRPAQEAEDTLKSAGLDPARPIVGLMPGSRSQEVESFTSTLLGAARRLKETRPSLQFVLPVAAAHLRSQIERAVAVAGLQDCVRTVSAQHYAFLARCELVLLASGTATLEMALLGVPMVVFYRVHPATYLAARALVRTPFIAMPNILLSRAVVPELIQGAFTEERLAAEAGAILGSPARAQAIRRDLARIPEMLGRPGVIDRVAELILRQLAPEKTERQPDRPAACAATV
jgi:lipid-A-disaccharide synthase